MLPLRILHLVVRPRHSGAEIVVGHLVRQQIAGGNALAIGSLGSCDPSFADTMRGWREAGARLYVPESESPPGWKSAIKRVLDVRKALVDFRPDVVFAHSVIPSAYARLASRRAEVVTVLHSASQDDYLGGPYALGERVLPSPCAVVGVTELGAENYRRRFSPRFPVVTIPNGIDLRSIRIALAHDQSELRRSLTGDRGRSLVLQVGRISPVKQQHLSIQAVGSLKKRGRELVLALAGLVEDPGYQAHLESLVDEFGLGGDVLFLGARSDVPALLASADVVLMPSKQEAHSLALLEALASQRPVVASAIQAFDFAKAQPAFRTVDPDHTGEYANVIDEALATETVWRDMDAFSIERMASCYDEIARRVLR